VYIEVKDPKVVEFFRSVLKDGQPADDVIRMLLENPCKAKRLIVLAKYESRLTSVLTELITNMAMYTEYVVAKRVATAVIAAKSVVDGANVKETTRSQNVTRQVGKSNRARTKRRKKREV